MAPRVRSSKLENRSARLRLPRRKKPYSVPIMRGVSLLYRRNKVVAGPFMVRVCRSGEDWTELLGVADDHDEADGKHILTYWQAQDLARERARIGKPTNDLSVKALVERYRADLESRGRDPTNATRVLHHLTDERVVRRPWKSALKVIGASEAGVRNVVLSDTDRRTLRGAAYAHDGEFGLLIDVLDETGARPSQVARLTAEDVQADFFDARTGKRQPRLLVPVSRKGRGRKARAHIPVPITPALADRLRGREPGVLLQRADGVLWGEINLAHYFDRAMEGVAFDNSAKVTMYALRHTSIVRQLLANVPVRVVAALHDTSVTMIERNYSKFIADHADELARATLPAPAEVVSLDDRRPAPSKNL